MASHKSAAPPVVRHRGPRQDYRQSDKTPKHSDYQQEDEGGEQSDLRQSAELSEQSDYEQSDEEQVAHHPTTTAHREAARGTANVAKPGEGKKGSRWRCPLDMGSFSSAVVGGLLVFGLSFINPWSNYSDHVYKVNAPCDMRAATSKEIEQIVTQKCMDIINKLDLNTSIKNQINEELDKTKSNLMNDLEARDRDAKVDIRKSVETDIQREVRKLHESVIQHADMGIEEAVGNVKDSLNASLQTRIQEALWKQNDTLEKMEQKVNVSLHECVRVNNISVANAERQWKAKFGDLQLSQELVYDVIKGMGFMRSGSWGMLIIVMGAMEIILYVFIWVSFKNRRPRHPDVSPAVQVAPPAQVDRGDRNTLCIVCFVDRDVAQVQRWTEEIVRETRASQRMHTLTHVIASRRDIQSVPTCRLALVFVNPDERQLILEDEYHMGSTRRDTVEAVRRKGAEVILIAYSDPTSRIPVLADGQLFDPSLTQVTSHPVLRDLNSNRRVLSVKESFSEYQKRYLIDSFDQIFT